VAYNTSLAYSGVDLLTKVICGCSRWLLINSRGIRGGVCQEGLQENMIGRLCAAESRKLQPQHENGLEREVPGQVVEDDTKGDALEEIEEAKDSPVRQPLDVILGLGGLNRSEGEVSWKSPTDEVRDWRRERVYEVEEHKERDSTNDSVGLGDLCALLESVEDGVLGQLLVKLANIVVGLVGRLLEDGMLLDFLRCGHFVVGVENVKE